MMMALLSLGASRAGRLFRQVLRLQAAVGAGLVRLAIIGVLNAIIGLYYYLTSSKSCSWSAASGLKTNKTRLSYRQPPAGAGLTTFGFLFLGVYATPWYDLATKAPRRSFSRLLLAAHCAGE